MGRIELKTQTRTTRGKKVKQLRANKLIPAVVYSADLPTRAIQVQERLLYQTLQSAGSTTLIDLFVDGEPEPYMVLAREVQRDVLTGNLLHVDFYQVRLTEKVKTTPRLEFVGESPLDGSSHAVIIYNMNEIEVECLPTDLIRSIPVDLTTLQNVDDSIFVSDLPVPSGVTVLADPDDVVVSVVPIRMALAEEEEEVEGLEVEGVEVAEEVEAEAEE